MDEASLSIMAVEHIGAFSLGAAILTVSLATVRMAKRKGYSGPILVWAWVPLLNIYGLMLFSRLPDKAARQRMDELATRLARPDA